MNLKAMISGIFLVTLTGLQAQAALYCELSQLDKSHSTSQVLHYGEFQGTNYWILKMDGTLTLENANFDIDNYKGAKIFASFFNESQIKVALMDMIPTGLTVSAMAIGDKSAPVSLITGNAKLVCEQK